MDGIVDHVLRSMVEEREKEFGRGAAFVSFQPDGDVFDWSSGYNSNAHFGRVVYERDKTRESVSVVLKVAPKVLFFKEFRMLPFVNETFFYSKLAPFFDAARRIGHLFPKCYDSLMRVHPAGDEAFIVLENLQAVGYVSAGKKSFLDFDHLSLMLRKLGEFHAYSYQTRQADPSRFHGFVGSCQETNFFVLKQIPVDLSRIVTRGLRPLSGDARYSSRLAKVAEMIDGGEHLMVEILTGDRESPTAVVCHGDYLSTNVMFKYENEKPVDLKMVDMASWRLASPVVDLAHVLYVNASQQMRNEHWDDLINEYYSALKGTFPLCEVPSRESLLKEFERRSMLGYIIASYFLPNIIAIEQNVSDSTFTADQFKGGDFDEGLMHVLVEKMENVGGEKGTEALADILKDLVDRGFV